VFKTEVQHLSWVSVPHFLSDGHTINSRQGVTICYFIVILDMLQLSAVVFWSAICHG